MCIRDSAITQGFQRNVVVLTRNKGYRKKGGDLKLPSFVYKKYPRLRDALSCRCQCYNNQLEMIERMEEEGRVLVIRPEKPIVVGRMEKSVSKLTDLYNEGYECAAKVLQQGNAAWFGEK